jgi:hypothetical protein
MTLINIIFNYEIIYYFQNQNLIEVVSPMEIFPVVATTREIATVYCYAVESHE